MVAAAKIILYLLMSVCIFCMIVSAIKHRRPVRTLCWSGGLGVLSLAVVSAVGYFSAVPTLFINMWTLLCAFVTGLPGVILMLLTRLIWNV